MARSLLGMDVQLVVGLGSIPAPSLSCLPSRWLEDKPCKTLPYGDLNQIAWHLMPWIIRFTFFVVVYSDGILAPSYLPHRTSPVVTALPSYWTVIKFSTVCSICVVDYCLCIFVFCCCVVFYVVTCAALLIRSCTMMYVIFATLIVGS